MEMEEVLQQTIMEGHHWTVKEEAHLPKIMEDLLVRVKGIWRTEDILRKDRSKKATQTSEEALQRQIQAMAHHQGKIHMQTLDMIKDMVLVRKGNLALHHGVKPCQWKPQDQWDASRLCLR